MKRIYKYILGIVITILCTVDLFSQEEQLLNPTELKQLTVVSEPATLYKGFFRAGVVFNYNFINQLFDKNGKRFLQDNTFGRTIYFDIHAQYGITNRFQADIIIPYLHYDFHANLKTEAPELNIYQTNYGSQIGKGLGDIDVGLKYQLLEPKYGSRFLTATLLVTLPTGESETSEDNLVPPGDGHFSFDLALRYEKIIYPNRFSCYVSYDYNMAATRTIFVNNEAIDQEIKTGSAINLIGSWDILLNDWIAIRNQIQFTNAFPDTVDGETYEYDYGDQFDSTNKIILQYLPTLSFQISRLRLNQFLSLPIAGKNTGADPGFTLIVQYVF